MFIVGAGQAAYEKRADRPVQRVLWEALDVALGVSRAPRCTDVDGLAATAFVLPPDNVTTLAEHFGLAPRWALFQGLYGGASGVVSVLHAARAIQAGDADVVACIAADVFDTAAHDDMLDHFNGSVRDYMAPFGFGGANGTFALHTRLYMEKHGATRAGFRTPLRGAARECAAQPQRTVQEAAGASGVSRRPADRRTAPAVRLRASLHRRRRRHPGAREGGRAARRAARAHSRGAGSSTTFRPTTSTDWSAVAMPSPSGCTLRPAAVPGTSTSRSSMTTTRSWRSSSSKDSASPGPAKPRSSFAPRT